MHVYQLYYSHCTHSATDASSHPSNAFYCNVIIKAHSKYPTRWVPSFEITGTTWSAAYLASSLFIIVLNSVSRSRLKSAYSSLLRPSGTEERKEHHYSHYHVPTEHIATSKSRLAFARQTPVWIRKKPHITHVTQRILLKLYPRSSHC